MTHARAWADEQERTPSDPSTTVQGDAAHLLTGQTTDRYQSELTACVQRMASAVAGVGQPFTGITPAQLAPQVAGIDLDAPCASTAEALDELAEVYLRDAVWFHHPRYLAHLNCPVAIPALVGEAVLTSVNSSLDTWDQSAGATLIEQRLIAWTASRIGFGDHADGVFTSGGTQSNLQALLMARDECLDALLQEGAWNGSAADAPRLRILASEVSHFSVQKSARVLGLGPDAVVPVACDADYRMSPAALRAALARCRAEGAVPMAVVTTAGTTDFGSIDPLEDVAEACDREGVWMHVDAAYGCGLLVSGRRPLLRGIERAASVTVDFHKSFFQPVSSSAVVVADRRALHHVTYHADYLNPASSARSGVPNQVDKSMQTTRRFDALKLWLTLRVMGADGVGRLFDEVVDRTAQAWSLLDADPRFEVLVRPQLSTLVFRYLPSGPVGEDVVDAVNLHARQAISASGEAVVAGTKVRGRHFLKLTLLNPATSLQDVADVLELVADNAGAHLATLTSTTDRVTAPGRSPIPVLAQEL